ncbi:MAG: hypothetical protein J0L55_16710, partial [Caulobacterales bacterium]|nr:hypothetical protein [Caulobacterales bacterium]
MSDIGKAERVTQTRIVKLFTEGLGYEYLGDYTDRPNNSNIEEKYLTQYLENRGYTNAQISAAIYKLRTEADNHSRTLYGNNKAVYGLLRYGVQVKTDVAANTETVHLI